jgi:hypothetical protein
LVNIARQTSIAGILVSLILFSLFGTLFFFHNKFINFINKNLNASNLTNLTLINKMFELSANTTLRSKHKLHYEIISFYTATKSINQAVTINTTFVSSGAAYTTSTLVQNGMSSILNRTSKYTNTNKLVNATRTSSTCTIKYYDKLSILIDHDFLTNIFLKYKIFKKKL